jgi:branched-chain amino acid transport system permease protein
MRLQIGRSIPIAVAAVVLAVLPFVLPSFVVFDMIFVASYAIAILGLIVLTGMNGQISLGHGALMMIGGYVVAICLQQWQIPYIISVPLAALVTGAFGLLFGLVALRLAGVYLALATFALAVAMPSLFKHFKSITGGFGGITLTSVTAPAWFPMDNQRWLYYVAWVVTGLAFAATALLVRGRFGRALRALRDNPTAAISFGINPYTYKTLAFGWSAVLAGLAGAFFALPTAYVSPDSFQLTLSTEILIGAVLGGIMSFWGAIVGAVIIQFLPLWAQQINAGAPSVVYGVVLIVVMLFVPDGVVGGLRRGFARLRPTPLVPTTPASSPSSSSTSSQSVTPRA